MSEITSVEDIVESGVLITDQLDQRPCRPPNLEAEVQILRALGQQLTRPPKAILKYLVEAAVDLCQAGSAGVSLIETSSSGEAVFRWVAIAGAYESYEGDITEREWSPCGVCLSKGCPQLYHHPERYFDYLASVDQPIVEGLVVPLRLDGQALGTIWIVSHDQQRQFDSEDVRIMTSLADFTTAALQSRLRYAAEASQQALHQNQAQTQALMTELRDAQVQLESALIAGGVYPWRWNIKRDRVIVNAAFAHLFAVDPVVATTEGLPVTFFINSMHADDRPHVAATIQQAIATGEKYTSEYRVRTASGEERWLTARGQVEYDKAGNPVSFPGVVVDITDRKQAEELLRLNEQRLRLALKTGKLGSWQLDLKTNKLLTSDQCKANYGFLPDADFTHQALFDRIHPDDRGWVEESIQQAIAQHSDYNVEYRTVWDDNSLHWALVRGCTLYEPDGTPLQMLGVSLDITDRKRIEAEQEQLLEREQAARAEAEQANRIKDEFLAVLSHELRSPLNPILGWSNLLRRGRLDAEQTAHALEVIERNAQLQVQLIEDLLDVSRILRGKLILNRVPVDLSVIIRAALETVRLAADAKSIQIQTELESAIVQVLGDSARLQQIIWNLLTNAVKFTPEGGRVEIRLQRVGTQAQIQVQDTGKGIAPDFLPHVFEYFRQADNSTTRKFGGLGLGLAIVHHLVELHGGTVQVESLGEGQGATFTVRLPLVLAQPIQAETRVDDSSVRSSLPLSGIKILVVDDEADNRDFCQFVLEQSGALVTAAASGDQALEMLAFTKPDILLSDVGMPKMDGYMLIWQIRAWETERGATPMRAIALTAYAGEFNQQQALAAGFQHHLSKPISPHMLIDAVINVTVTR